MATGNLRYDASLTNEKRSVKIFKDLNLNFNANAVTKDITKLNPFKKKWESFGWKVIEIDGHNHKMIEKSFKMKKINKPILIIARTVKGKGVSFMEDDNNWHYRVPTKKELLLAKTELGLD